MTLPRPPVRRTGTVLLSQRTRDAHIFLYRFSHGRLTSPLQLIRKYGQYHRPIARPIFFWLNGGSFMSPGGLCHPSDDFESKF
jgi:hypothetical protein